MTQEERAIREEVRKFCLNYCLKEHSGTLPPLIRNAQDGSILALVPAGEFEMGDGKDSDCPKHRVYLDAYYFGVYCVTNRQYEQFVKETGHRPPDNKIWQSSEKSTHPVTDVSWDDAKAYCEWAGLILPTEAQWEKGARGPAGLIYPWGNEWDQNKCRNDANKGSGTTAPVAGYPAGISGHGTYQQSGNVWEWCRDRYDSGYYGKSPQRNPGGPSTGSYRVSRGGSWNHGVAGYFRGAPRNGAGPSRRYGDGGFRVALLPPGQR